MSGMSEFEEDDEYAVGDMMDPLATDASDRRDLLRRTRRRWSSSSSLSDPDEDDEGAGPSLGRELALRWSASLRRTAVCLARGVIFAATGADTDFSLPRALVFLRGRDPPVEVEDAPSEDRSSTSGPNRCDDDREGRAVEVRRTRGASRDVDVARFRRRRSATVARSSRRRARP